MTEGTLYNKDGNPVLCKCGNPATSGCLGKEAYILWCSSCSPLPTYSSSFVYRPPTGPPIAQNATVAVKFAQGRCILDDWYLFGGTRWSRFLFRMKHPIVYSKRGLHNIYRSVKRIFVKERMIKCNPKRTL